MNGQDDDRPPTRELSEEECWRLIEAAPYGRIAAAAGGEVDIFPVNHKVDVGPDGHAIVFRTAPGTKLLELTIHANVAFEVDGHDEGAAYSVVAKGRARQLERDSEIERVAGLGVTPWAPEPKDRWVRVDVTEVGGRSFQRRQPE
ncbi:pyridoxamine 5'-phosphate oxidase family protein [Agromyces aurantiacus]|uniref:Pyridoxamine 5'-phosphate oxidase family protein n=1 Tax=Agromyces aurantiacus TaxID=165814 RepID=A0ABV9R4D0_9MICO|nr:pyridoxamine 5'-phosphate oxidase family protein [Agromyces aurantiacus]MBM7502986.1 nitroimidazol reductase NimA-like FMN-containing flavoprotein (pyridoxamine 5'-phosphate oxidase superfamily) [Agromyces aurantiacus]